MSISVGRVIQYWWDDEVEDDLDFDPSFNQQSVGSISELNNKENEEVKKKNPIGFGHAYPVDEVNGKSRTSVNKNGVKRGRKPRVNT